MMRAGSVFTVVSLFMTPAAAIAQVPYAGPWDPRTDAVAHEAVDRLGAHRALDIPALSGRIQGDSKILATVEQVRQALNDLHATEHGREVQVDLPSDVLFEFDRADIRPEAAPSLEEVATVLNAYPKSDVTIEGHTDGKGNAAYNQALSERRATSVRTWLDHRGIRDVRIETHGFGATQPVAPNMNKDGSDNPDGRRQNRRVRIIIKKAA